ncbi:MAG: DUF1573 domain-containing protein [Candidatus Nealsonbacteria bacterium]|nr:DUF1573 domain-containing protein [Candidatus Nealsonbacteria bacterium]
MTKLIIAVLGGTVLLMGGIIVMDKGGVQASGGQIELSPATIDLGTVSMANGNVKTTYQIKNIGKEALKIDRVWTSCMCTTAVLKLGDKTSPAFGMHDSSSLWSQEIQSGEEALLEVTFDPALHGPEGVGQLTRAIYLSTSDPSHKKAEVRFNINVTP